MKFQLKKIRINQSGYDSDGRYWGIGLPLYHFQFEAQGRIVESFLRAPDRKTAKQLVIDKLSAQFQEVVRVY